MTTQQDFSEEVRTIREEDIIASFNDFILKHLRSILNGSKDNWRYQTYNSYTSPGMVEKKDLKFSVNFGDFMESQTYLMVNVIAKQIATKCLMEGTVARSPYLPVLPSVQSDI